MCNYPIARGHEQFAEWIANIYSWYAFIMGLGRYGGTYAHKDIAFEFAMWISPEFKIYIVKEFQRLKEEKTPLTENNN